MFVTNGMFRMVRILRRRKKRRKRDAQSSGMQKKRKRKSFYLTVLYIATDLALVHTV